MKALAHTLFALSLSAAASAQELILERVPSANETKVGFTLQNPTGSISAPKHVMLACYLDLPNAAGEQDSLVQLIRKSVGALDGYTSSGGFVVPGTAANSEVPAGAVYRVPPEIIGNAITEINWEELGGYAQPFPANMSWHARGMEAPVNAMPWHTMVSAGSTLSDTFDVGPLMHACVARQIAYRSEQPVDSVGVQTQTSAILEACRNEAVPVSINVVAVEFLNGGPSSPPDPPRIRLSRNIRITLQVPGAGGNGGSLYHWNLVFPVAPLLPVHCPILTDPVGSDFDLFIPTTNGYEAREATLYTYLEGTEVRYALRATMPSNVVTGEFAAWNATTGSYLVIGDAFGASTIAHVFYAGYPGVYAPFPQGSL